MQATNRQDVINLLRAKQGKRTLQAFGDTFNCSAVYLSDIYAGKRQPGPKILAFLGFEKQVTYTKKRASR